MVDIRIYISCPAKNINYQALCVGKWNALFRIFTKAHKILVDRGGAHFLFDFYKNQKSQLPENTGESGWCTLWVPENTGRSGWYAIRYILKKLEKSKKTIFQYNFYRFLRFYF